MRNRNILRNKVIPFCIFYLYCGMNSTDINIKLDPSTWVDDYADYLFSYAISRVSKKEVVEDLVQDTFLSALKAKGGFRYKSTVRTWLTSILRNKIFDYYKQSKKMDVRLGGDDEFNNGFFEKGGFDTVWKDKSFDQWEFESALESENRFLSMLKNCVENLSSLHQSIFTLRNMEGYDVQEICKVLDIKESNYWVITHRSKLKLKKCVQLNWFFKSK